MTQHIIDHGITLYAPVMRYSNTGKYFIPESDGAGWTQDGLIDDITTGQIEDIALIMCIWGSEAGTDQTEAIRGECFDAVDWYGEAEDMERNTPAFVKAHKGWAAALAEHTRELAEQRAHEKAESLR